MKAVRFSNTEDRDGIVVNLKGYPRVAVGTQEVPINIHDGSGDFLTRTIVRHHLGCAERTPQPCIREAGVYKDPSGNWWVCSPGDTRASGDTDAVLVHWTVTAGAEGQVKILPGENITVLASHTKRADKRRKNGIASVTVLIRLQPGQYVEALRSGKHLRHSKLFLSWDGSECKVTATVPMFQQRQVAVVAAPIAAAPPVEVAPMPEKAHAAASVSHAFNGSAATAAAIHQEALPEASERSNGPLTRAFFAAAAEKATARARYQFVEFVIDISTDNTALYKGVQFQENPGRKPSIRQWWRAAEIIEANLLEMIAKIPEDVTIVLTGASLPFVPIKIAVVISENCYNAILYRSNGGMDISIREALEDDE